MSLDGLVDRLAKRGMVIPDRERALRYLRHIGYYRLSPYAIPFQKSRPDHLLREGTSFDDVLDLYVFDRALRLLVLDALERVEVAVRAALTDHMSTSYQNPFWYAEPGHFQHVSTHNGLLKMIGDTSDSRLLAAAEHTGESGHGVGAACTQSEAVVTHRSALEHILERIRRLIS
mgnify:FL=1